MPWSLWKGMCSQRILEGHKFPNSIGYSPGQAQVTKTDRKCSIYTGLKKVKTGSYVFFQLYLGFPWGCFGRFWKPSMLNMFIWKVWSRGRLKDRKKCVHIIQHINSHLSKRNSGWSGWSNLRDSKKRVELVEAPLMSCCQKIWLRGMLGALENILQNAGLTNMFQCASLAG